ncbi:MAG: hypothetical protein RI955_1989 [Bacteroidota bacterium]|jgi:hypothetical protein
MKHIRFYFALLGIVATIYFSIEYFKTISSSKTEPRISITKK